MELYSNKYYEVIITTAKVEGDSEPVNLYGILNKNTGIIEEKMKNYPTAVEVCEELNKWTIEHYRNTINEGGSNVTPINGSNTTVQ